MKLKMIGTAVKIFAKDDSSLFSPQFRSMSIFDSIKVREHDEVFDLCLKEGDRCFIYIYLGLHKDVGMPR